MRGIRRRVVTAALAAAGALAAAALLLWIATGPGGEDDAVGAALPKPARGEPERPLPAPDDTRGSTAPPDLPAPQEAEPETGEPFWSWEKADPRPEPPPGETGSISGRVVDDAGQPIVGAEVQVSSYEFWADALTDAFGAFSIPGLPPDEYDVGARFEESRVEGDAPFLVEARLDTPAGDLVLVPGGTVEGEVEFPGAPPEEFTIVWRRAKGRLPRKKSFRTASPPSFSVVLMPDEYAFLALAPGYAASTKATVAVVSRGVEHVVLSLRRGASLSGSVRTREGAPAVGARVSVRPEIPTLDDFRSLLGLQTTADGEGWFLVAGLEQGTYVVEASVPGRAPAVAPVEIEGAEHTIDLVLPAGCRLEGLVVDESGAPQAGAGVIISQELDRSVGAFEKEVRTDARGCFALEDLPPGRYRVRAHAFSERSRPPRSGTARVEIPDGGVAQVRVAVE